MDEIVKQQVAAILEMHIPQGLQDELAANKRTLAQLQRKLHNS